MRHLLKRVQKLETARTDVNGLVPYSPAWFRYLDDKLERLWNGEKVDLTGVTLDYIDAFMAQTEDVHRSSADDGS